MSVVSLHRNEETGFSKGTLAEESPWKASDNVTIAHEKGVPAMLQSTPVGSIIPSLDTYLPSAIKDDKEPKNNNRKSLISRLASITERPWGSPRRIAQKSQNTTQPTESNNNNKNNNNITTEHPVNADESTEPVLEETVHDSTIEDSKSPTKKRCSCASCVEALEKDAFSNPPSEVSNSLSSLPQSPYKNQPNTREPSLNDLSEEDTISISTSQRRSPMHFGKGLVSNGIHQLSRLINATMHSKNRRSPVSSESRESDASVVSTKRRWKTNASKGNFAPILSCRKKSLTDSTISLRGEPRNPSLIFQNRTGNDSYELSAHLMFLRDHDADPDSQSLKFGGYYHSARRSRYQMNLLSRDPPLRSLLEELKRITLLQESILKQASKALDGCNMSLLNRMSEGVYFAECILHTASERYFAAETELHRLIDGGVFEPQRDVLHLKKIQISFTKDFLSSARNSSKNHVFLVLIKSGHNVETSELIELNAKNRVMTIAKQIKSPNGTLEVSPYVFHFNQPDWQVSIEVFCVQSEKKKENHVSVRNVKSFLQNIDPRHSVSQLYQGSDHSVDVRKSSFGLVGGLKLTRESILAKSPYELDQSQAKILEPHLCLEGELHKNQPVFFHSYLIVKDFNGLFGLNGQMKTFYVKLSNSLLQFFEVSDECNEEASAVKTINLENLNEDSIVDKSEDGTYFYDFTLKLSESKNSWLDLCTNSKEDSAQWISHLKTAVLKPTIIHL